MPTFHIVHVQSQMVETYVEADSEEEAIQYAKTNYDSLEFKPVESAPTTDPRWYAEEAW